ncbi:MULTISPECIES: response regulator [Corynebacterium]|uniref:Two component transcriptional regulator, LuxR family n=1 Tax=Corynebacterium singulare TaxID=161899 RepID=A0A0B6F4E2_9CORY|nr:MULTISPECIES: response regulator transcription factor [Corynebacterium]AJI79320.1 two component transcriptional regulator, LuxR family [Corynebacterium singulare]MCQ9675630.1 response regulator transcription factor [Corynebacterium sp. BF-R-2]
MSIRVLLADDQVLLVSALSTILNAAPDIEVVAQVANGVEAVAATGMHRIDVAVLDIRMPHMDGIAAAKAIKAAHPNIQVVMLTTFHDDELVADALQAGANGFLLKDADPDILASTVRSVAAGESVLSTKVTGSVLNSYRAAMRSGRELTTQQRKDLELVTVREMDVLRLVAEGLTNGEIADHLHVAETTVKTHVSSLLAKLQARDRIALVLFAVSAGLVSS